MKKNLNILTLSMGAGGAEKVIYLLLPRLVKDFNVNLILFTQEIHFEIPNEVKVIFLSSGNNQTLFSKLISPLSLIPKYRAILTQTRPDISLSFLTRANFLNSFMKNKKTKVIISERCFPSIAYKSNILRYSLYKLLIPLLYNRADAAFSNSKFINIDLKTNFKVHIPLSVIYNPVACAEPIPFLNSNDRPTDILWVGKLNAIKNPNLLLEALQLAKCKYNTTVLGAGRLLDSLKGNSTGLNVDYKGKVTNVTDYLQKSKIFVLTSHSEGFPNVILEAMSFGLPIISTNCKSGPLELLNDGEDVEIPEGTYKVVKYGILINVNDSTALSLAIDMLLRDIELMHYLSKMSFKRSKEYTISNIYGQLKSIL